MMQRNVGVQARAMTVVHQPAVTEIMPLHRDLFCPEYVNDDRLRKGAAAKSLAFTLGDSVHGGLKPGYLSRVIKAEDGLSWSQMFGNFMGTAAAFRALLNTVRQDERGFVTIHDSLAIRALFVALHNFRPVVNQVEGNGVSNAMQRSAAFCGGLIDDLRQQFHVPDHWATVAPDGETIVVSAVDRKALVDPRLKKLSLVNTVSGAVTLLTASGLDAFKAWAKRAADINNFMDSVSVPVEAVVGTDQTAIRVEEHVRVEGLPVAPHPSYASSVHRVLVELMAIAERSGMPSLQFGYNGWRQAYEARVPVSYAEEFRKAVRDNEEMGSLRGEHDWWMQRVMDQVIVVIPTQPAIHMRHFVNFSESLLKKIAVLYNHFHMAVRLGEIDLDARDGNDSSIRMKLQAFEKTFQELLVMQQFLVAERDRDPNLKTQESYAVSALLQRLMFLAGPYRNVYVNRNDPGSLYKNIGRALNSNVFHLLEHMPGYNANVPRVDLSSIGQLFPFTPENWADSYQLEMLLYELMVDSGGSAHDDHRHDVNVHVNYTLDHDNSSIVFSNPDGNFIDRFVDPDKESHLVPGLIRRIYKLARKVAPPGGKLVIDRVNRLLIVPIKAAETNLIDARGVPQSPRMGEPSAPHPSLFKSDGG